MTTHLTPELVKIGKEVGEFADRHVAGRDFNEASGFPWDVWRAMADLGLFGLGLPEQYGGRGGGFLEMAVAGEALVRRGGSLGLALSLGLNHVVASFLINGFGTTEQKERFLPDLAAGRTIGCMAVSEPKTGAHPRHLRTSAQARGGLYVLNGEKTYLTNGPIADVFVVMAVTGETDGRKRFTAFITPGDAKGLERTDPIPLGFLHPSPHGGIRLTDAEVPAANILGPGGEAYEAMVKPFREIEDTLLLGPMAGGLTRQLALAAGMVKTPDAAEGLAAGFGLLRSRTDLAGLLAHEAAAMLDSGGEHPDLVSLLLSGRSLVRDFQNGLRAVLEEAGVEPDPHLQALTNDLTRANQLAQNIMRQKRIRLGRLVLGAEVRE